MAQQSLAQARIVDPILTTVARGYRSKKAAIANVLFPRVPVQAMGGRIIAFGPDDFKLISTIRAPGSNTKRVQFGYASTPYALSAHRLEGSVPWENQQEAMNGPGIDLGAGAVARVQNLMELERENQAAVLARDVNNYDASNKIILSGATLWTNTASDPFAQIEAAKEAIRSQTGETPNALGVAPKALSALRTHPKVLDRLSTASDRPPATLAQLQALFELETIVKGDAVVHDGTSFGDLWGTDAVLAFTQPASAQEQGSPSFGYTYSLEDGLKVEEAYYGNNEVTWYYPVSDAYQAVIAGKSAGYLFKNAGAAA